MAQKLCRLCLVKPSVYFSLQEGNLAEMLGALTLGEVNLQGEFSTIVCLKCLLNLKLAYNFQQRIKKSEKRLCEQLEIKPETQKEKDDHDLVQLCDKKCVVCGVKIANDVMNDHIRDHFNSEQKCSFCDKVFTGIQQYREHLFGHPEKTLHKCVKCPARFKYKSFYDEHMKSVCCVETATKRVIGSLESRANKKINSLGKTTKNIRTRPNALSQVSDEKIKNQVYRLGLCSSKAIKMLTENKVNKPKPEKRVCNICFKTFTKASFLIHTHETKTCNICNREITKYQFKRHMNEHSMGPQVCHLCGATLRNKNCLNSHLFYTHSEMRYKCDHCGKLFQKKCLKELHVQKEHIGKPSHVCDSCGKGFFSRTFLRKHIRMTHLKLRPHICDYCKKGYSSRHALKTHVRIHTKETPYRCEICGEGFKQNTSLKAHRKSKHNIVEATVCHCKVCGKGFSSDIALNSHMRFH